MAAPKLTQLSKWGLANSWAEGRSYVHPHSLRVFPSVTTVLKKVRKDLEQWSADKAMEWAVENYSLLANRSDEAAFNAGRYRWKDFRDERAQVGTGVHETIESLNSGGWNFPELDEEQLAIMAQWDLLCSDHYIEPLYSEVTMFNQERGDAGTFDGYWYITCLHDGPTCLGQEPGESVRTLVDIKTSRKVWPDHEYQLAALWSGTEWLIEVGDMKWLSITPPPIDAVAIIHLREDHRQIIPVQHLELNSSIYESYVGVWYAENAMSEALKAEAKLEKEEVLSLGFS